MVTRFMVQHELCQQCNQRHDCGKVYEQLGNNKGPSIVWKVVLAFLLPLVVFTVSLVMFEKIFSGVLSKGPSHSILSFVTALLLTFICIILTKLIRGKFGQAKKIV